MELGHPRNRQQIIYQTEQLYFGGMNPRLRIALKWLLVLPVIGISLLAAMIAMQFSILLDRPLLARICAIGIKLSPPSLLQPLHLLVMLGVASMLALPSTLAVGFAFSVRPRECLPWGFSIATLFTATFVWFVSSSANPSLSRLAASDAAAIVIGGIVLAFFTSQRHRTHVIANTLGILILFVPSLSVLAHPKKYPPEPQKVWSAVLQEQTWQAMNTGSEYAATRQVVFAGDRVLAVFDSGSAGYAGKVPMSNYRLLSLDRRTGAKKNEIDFTGRWGTMPYIYATNDDHVDVQSNPPRVLNPDLSSANESVVASTPKDSGEGVSGLKRLGKCEVSPWIPVDAQSWLFECGAIRIMDREGRVLAQRPVVDGSGRFAGASRDGSRFALESSESEGDPPFLLYEHFTIYDGHTATAVAMVSITDLPERQSWSALSPDGKYFVVGNPNKLSLYRLPGDYVSAPSQSGVVVP